MAQPGDLVLVFADSLTRSWKQITKFRPAGAPEAPVRIAVAPPTLPAAVPVEAAPLMSLEGLLRDERGIRVAPDVDD
jgi:cyanophycin synthetase